MNKSIKKTVSNIDHMNFQGVGQVTLRESKKVRANFSYDYDPTLDPNRKVVKEGGGIQISYGDEGLGVVIPRGEIYSLTGETIDNKPTPFSLFAGRIKNQSSSLFAGRLSEEWEFKYGLIGFQCGFEESLFSTVSFSFNLHEQWGIFNNKPVSISRIQNEQNSPGTFQTNIENILSPVTEWEIQLEDGIILSLSLKTRVLAYSNGLPINRQEIVTDVNFAIKSTNKEFSVKEAMDKWIEPLRSLLTIAFQQKETIKSVTFSHVEGTLVEPQNQNHTNVFHLYGDTIGEKQTQNNHHNELFNPGLLPSNFFKDWISKWRAISSRYSVLEDAMFNKKGYVSLPILLARAEDLYSLHYRSEAVDDKGRLTDLLSWNDTVYKTLEFFTDNSVSKVGRRLKESRTYWIHKAMEQDHTHQSSLELYAHLKMMVAIYTMTILRFAGMDKKNMINLITDEKGTQPVGAAAHWRDAKTNGYGKWSYLDKLVGTAPIKLPISPE